MMKSPPQHRLSNELLRLILDYIEPDPDRTVPVDRRSFISVESFYLPPPSSRDSVRDIGRFRLASKRFAELGSPLLCTFVNTRLSRRGLQQLEQLTEWPHLAQHVKKFSYLVPYFYGDGGELVRQLLPALEASFGQFNVQKFNEKVNEQRQIVESKEDARVLKAAIACFVSLQHVRLLRVQDEEDVALLKYIREHEETHDLIHPEWAPACSHGSRTIGAALLASNVPWSRFSSPMLSPQSAEFLNWHRPRSLSILAERLTCLTLHFDDGNDLDLKMSQLSSLFRTVFTAATNMQAVHVGFPQQRPLNLPLKVVFHDVKWEKLVALGIASWKLDADEILSLALRHKERLKGLRLRDVLLREGSVWKDILGELRSSMHRLDWVSLRRIGYAKRFDDSLLAAGAEVPDDWPGGESDSDSEDEPYDDPLVESSNATHDTDEHEDNGDDTDGLTDSDDERSLEEHDMDFPPLQSPSTPNSAPWCNCNGRSFPDSAEHLGDDGSSTISGPKRKAWEKWVVRRCPEHSQW